MSCEASMITAHATNNIRMPILALPIGPARLCTKQRATTEFVHQHPKIVAPRAHVPGRAGGCRVHAGSSGAKDDQVVCRAVLLFRPQLEMPMNYAFRRRYPISAKSAFAARMPATPPATFSNASRTRASRSGTNICKISRMTALPDTRRETNMTRRG